MLKVYFYKHGRNKLITLAMLIIKDSPIVVDLCSDIRKLLHADSFEVIR